VELPGAAAITASLRLRRKAATGVPVSENVDHVVQALDSRLLVDLPEIRSSW
jgi:hypothetical protein